MHGDGTSTQLHAGQTKTRYSHAVYLISSPPSCTNLVLLTSRYAFGLIDMQAASCPLQITVPPELFDEMEKECADPLDPVFRLVPPVFEEYAITIYDQIGHPEVTSDNFWDVYTDVLTAFRSLPDDPELAKTLQCVEDDAEDEIPLLPVLRPLPDDRHRDPGVSGGAVDDLDLREFAYFTPSEDENDM